jgi:SAM-dependent methyltransferase
MSVLDAGCGTGETLQLLLDAVTDTGSVTGVDLSEAHVAAARSRVPPNVRVIQGNILDFPTPASSFDLVWCVNTINHLHNPREGIARLAALLRPGGRVAIAQSSLLADMFFAWDARLEAAVNDAVRRYYRSRYQLDESDLTSIRSLVGLLRDGGLRNVAARTVMIERQSPLDAASEMYLREAIFRDSWGERLRPFLSRSDFAELAQLCDCDAPEFALRRSDFHFLQTFTMVVGQL